MSDPVATVVVPTKDRPGPLAACLAAVSAQDAGPLQILVVDDASRDDRAVARVVGAVPGARVLRVRGSGPAAARNLGAQIAEAPVVCFTDDDCLPDAGWVAALVSALDAGSLAVAGPTRNGVERNACSSASQTLTNHLMATSRDPSGLATRFVPTCNLALRTEVARAHPFDESFTLAAGEDRDWCARLAEAGVAIGWAPDAVVDHHQLLTLRTFWRQQVRYGRGAHHYLAGRSNAARLHPRSSAPGLWRESRGQGWRVAGLLGVARVAGTLGVMAETVSPSRPR